MKKIIFLLAAATLLAACGGGNNLKRVLVISRGQATIDKDTKTITVTSGTSSEEQTIDFDIKDNITLQLSTQAGKSTVDLTEPGYYVLNAKPDTIVGCYQHYGSASATKTYTQDFIKQQLDSLQQLITDKNVSAANRNFFLLPNHAVKITGNTDAFVVGPFHNMTSIQQQGDKEPEVYRFYMVSEIRETIEHLKQLTTAPPSPNQ